MGVAVASGKQEGRKGSLSPLKSQGCKRNSSEIENMNIPSEKKEKLQRKYREMCRNSNMKREIMFVPCQSNSFIFFRKCCQIQENIEF